MSTQDLSFFPLLAAALLFRFKEFVTTDVVAAVIVAVVVTDTAVFPSKCPSYSKRHPPQPNSTLLLFLRRHPPNTSNIPQVSLNRCSKEKVALSLAAVFL